MRYVNSIEKMIIEEHRQAGLMQGLEKGLEQGLEQGLAKGRQEGLLAGETKLLAKQLERRFGQLPGGVVSKLNSATEQDLERWGEAVLTAATLEAVFNDGARH